MTQNINRMDEINKTNILVFILIVVLTSCVIGIWFVLSTRLNNTNKHALTIDEQLTKLNNIQQITNSIYAPLTTVEHVESSLLDAMNKRRISDREAIDKLNKSVRVTTEEALKSCIDNVSKVNTFSREYANKTYSNTLNINSKFLDIENDIDSWKKHQEYSFSNLTLQQNKLFNAYKKNVEDVQKNGETLIQNVQAVDKNMNILKDNVDVLSQYNVKNNTLLDDKLTQYYTALNRLQSTTNRYHTNFDNTLVALGQSNVMLKTDLNDAKNILTKNISTINESVNKQIRDATSSLSDQLKKSYTTVNDSFDMYNSNIKRYITQTDRTWNFVNEELGFLKKPPTCRNIIGSICKENEYISGMIFEEVPRSTKNIIYTRCCKMK